MSTSRKEEVSFKKNKRTLKKRTQRIIAYLFIVTTILYTFFFFAFILKTLDILSLSISEIFGYSILQTIQYEDFVDSRGEINTFFLQETIDPYLKLENILSETPVFQDQLGRSVEPEAHEFFSYLMSNFFWVHVSIHEEYIYSNRNQDLFNDRDEVEFYGGIEARFEEWLPRIPFFNVLYAFVERFNTGSSRSIYNASGDTVGQLDVKINGIIVFVMVLILSSLQVFAMIILIVIALLLSNILVLPITTPIKVFNEKLALLASEEEKLEEGVELVIKKPLREFEEMKDSINQIIHSMNAYSNLINTRKEQLEEVRVELETQNQKLKRKTSQLEEVNKEMKHLKELAESATESKSNFLANMSHEIRTPMNAIIGFNDLLERTELSEKQYDYVQKIGVAANNLLGIINDILDFSKIEAGKLSFEKIEFNLDEVLHSVSNVVGKKAFDKGLEFVMVKSKDVPGRLKGDPLRLGQVLINLISNAIKFTEKGEVVVRIDSAGKEGKRWKLLFSVEDTGIGMTEEQKDLLFKAFTQADTSTTRKYGGTGLGLTISQTIVEMMEGEMGVSTLYGEGSTFTFTAYFEEGEDRAPLALDLSDRIRTLKVLVTDDHLETRQVISAYIENFGMEAHQASSGEEALTFADDTYDLLLMDWRMDGLNGIEALKKIKEKLGKEKYPRVIMITAYGGEELRGEDTEGIVDDFLQKPITHSILLDSILTLFGEKEKRAHQKKTTFDFSPVLKNIRGARLLLVEDNELNQQIGVEILQNEGFFVDVAGNGKIGYEMVLENSYDLVLMDLQMPILDGIEATVMIRKDERVAKDLPIIALSADAVSGTRKKILHAGMNGFVSKPIDKRELFNTLKKWIREGHRQEFLLEEKRLPPMTRDMNTDKKRISSRKESTLTTINVEEGMERVSGNQNLYQEILEKFASKSTKTLEEVRELLKRGDQEKMLPMLHALKGVSFNIGAFRIGQLAEEMEGRLKEEKAFPMVLFQELEKEIEKAREEILLLVGEGSLDEREEEIEISKEVFLSKFMQLKELLEDYDVYSLDVLLEIRSSLLSSMDKGLVVKMEQHIRGYRYEEALNIYALMEEKIVVE